MDNKKCTEEGCHEVHAAKGLCDKHYQANRRKNFSSEELELKREYERQYRIDTRNQVIEFLGGRCTNCGYNENILGLDIDHIDNDGAEIRRKQGKPKGGGSNYYQSMLKSGCKGLQVLCGTCHNIKSRSK